MSARIQASSSQMASVLGVNSASMLKWGEPGMSALDEVSI